MTQPEIETVPATSADHPSDHTDHRRQNGGLRGNPWLSLLAVALGVMLVGIDGTIVAVASPSMQEHLHASLAGIQWVTNGYLLALAVSLITVGKLGDRFGHVKFLLAGAAGFVLTSAAIGLAHSIGLIIALRVLQGVFGAMLQPTAMGVIRATFPQEKLNTAIGIWGGTVAASTAAGPIVGGLLVEHASWQWCFYVNVPVGIIAIALGLIVLRETPLDTGTRSFDVPGIALLSGALGLLIWGLIKAPDYGWGSGRTLGFLGGALALGLLFVWRESRASEPLLPLRLFHSIPLSAGTILVVLLAFALFGTMFFMSFFLQNMHGLSPVSSAMRTLPLTLTLIVGAPLASAAVDKVGPRIPTIVGMTLTTVGLFGLSRLHMTSNPSDTLPWFILLGLGLAPVMVAGTDVIVGNAPIELAGVAGGLQSTAMQVGGSLGTSILGAVMSSKLDHVLRTDWSAARLPATSTSQWAEVKAASSVGIAPVTSSMPKRVAELITTVSHTGFMDGLNLAFEVAGCITAAGILIAFLAKGGRKVEGAVPHV